MPRNRVFERDKQLWDGQEAIEDPCHRELMETFRTLMILRGKTTKRGGEEEKTIAEQLLLNKDNLDGLEVACLPRKLKVEGSSPAGVDRFSGCENRGHTFLMIIWHVKYPLSVNFTQQYLESDESLN
ncbi:hypothetical protein TNCV_3147311 [Trichonephila clavipes]|nr:hypothetical protein TNCV_3147311 [Trichonephila clavipes]